MNRMNNGRGPWEQTSSARPSYRPGDVNVALARLGIDAIQRNSELVALCPLHEERTGRKDNNPSWSINVDTGVHHCFSCGYKGVLLSLVAEVLDMRTAWDRLDFESAKLWIFANTDVDLDFLVQQLEASRDSYIPIPSPVQMSEGRLGVFVAPPQWALDARGLTAAACNTYGQLWDAKQESWISPIRHAETKKLMGWQEKGQTKRTFRNKPTGVVKSSTLFGLNVWDPGPMVIVESPLDAIKVAIVTHKYQGVSTYGAIVSEEQVALMRKSEKLIIAFDNPNIDLAGEKAALDMLSRVKSEGMECWFFNYADTGLKDIGDMTAEQIIWGIDNAKHCVFGEAAIYVKRH